MSRNLLSEKQSLDNIGASWAGHDPLHSFIHEAAMRAFSEHLDASCALELGAGTGNFSTILSGICGKLVTVEGSSILCDGLRKKGLPNHEVVDSLFEDFEPEKKFTAVFSCFVNEHVFDASIIYEIARKALLPGGKLFIITPNKQAMSRQLAQAMGLIKTLNELTPNDIAVGHRRTYDLDLLRKETAKNKFVIHADGGLLLKPFADFQMNELITKGMLTQDHLNGLEKLGQMYPQFCMSLYAVTSPE